MLWLIIFSIVIISAMVFAKLYEQKSGRSLWAIFRAEGLRRFLEIKIRKSLSIIRAFNSRNLRILSMFIWRNIKNYYRILQDKTAEKISKVGRPTAFDSHNNKAASFYLKSIREHKNNSSTEDIRNNLPE